MNKLMANQFLWKPQDVYHEPRHCLFKEPDYVVTTYCIYTEIYKLAYILYKTNLFLWQPQYLVTT